ncbi:MAG: hypothetical protein JNK93_16105, partial [Planctomycetia bacterium]|nr:hypothetical protein [Planctomycetia bacterium]
MPDATILQWCTYPGVPDFETASYSCTHGVTPGVVIATTRFPPDGAAPAGNFVITDGTRTLTLRDCKYQRREGQGGLPGSIYKMTLLDRRWRWAFGSISGTYNLKDDKGNLVPWTARTPTQLARLCLEAMGERGYLIDLPDGIGADQLDQTNDNPAPGQMTPPTGTNPLIEWVDEVPAQALARLCDRFGRRLIFDPVRDIVVIARPGDGAELPVDIFLMPNISYGVEAHEKPRGVGVVGDKVKYQMRLKLVPVGLEWDGRIVPIEELSYRPLRKPQVGKWKVVFSGGNPAPQTFSVTATIGRYTIGPQAGHATTADAATWLADAINGHGGILSQVSATASGSEVSFTGKTLGEVVTIAISFTSINVSANAASLVTVTQPPTKSAWDLSQPGVFGDVEPTSRLTFDQARNLAVQSVYRWYRVANEDISSGWDNPVPKFIEVPYFGKVDRRQHLEILPFKVQQVVPEKPDPNIINANGSPTLLPADQNDYYDGYNRSQQAVVYGSICTQCRGRWWHGNRQLNTPEGSIVGVPFAIDTANQMVIFNEPVYKVQSSTDRHVVLRPANLCLETGVHVLDNRTYAPVRYKRWIDFGPREPGSENRDRDIEVDLTKYGIKKAKPYTVKLPRRRENVGSNDVPAPGIQWYGHADDLKMGVIGYYQYDAAADRHTLVSASADEFEKKFQDMADSYLVGHILEH